jgi:hypothetical protein
VGCARPKCSIERPAVKNKIKCTKIVQKNKTKKKKMAKKEEKRIINQ